MDISQYQHINIRMSTRGKRPLRNLTPIDKVRAIQRIHNGETKASVSRDIGVPESTLRGWCKNEQKLRFMCRQLGADQLPIPVLENPPEKRTKFESHIKPPKFDNISNYENFGYNQQMAFNTMDFVPSSPSSNSILEKVAFNEFLKKSNFQPSASNADSAVTELGAFSDYSQLALMQNLNLLSLLNSNMTTMETNNTLTSGNRSNKANSIDETNTVTTSKTSGHVSASTLSVKTWAKDPSENLAISNDNFNNMPYAKNDEMPNINDTNNNNIKQNQLLTSETDLDVGQFPLSFAASPIAMPKLNTDSDCSNESLFEWCKMINAGFNFLALAYTVAATMQPQRQNASNTTEETTKEHSDLYKYLQKKSTTPSSSINTTSSDYSNDSCVESEPEDLSVRSLMSKLSSKTYSRSQSPAKSSISSSSTNTDAEHELDHGRV